MSSLNNEIKSCSVIFTRQVQVGKVVVQENKRPGTTYVPWPTLGRGAEWLGPALECLN